MGSLIGLVHERSAPGRFHHRRRRASLLAPVGSCDHSALSVGAEWHCRFLFGSRSLPLNELSLMPVAQTPGGILSTRIFPSAVVWVNRREATVVRMTSDGRMSTFEISRGWLREAPFLAHVVRAIGDQEHVLILGPGSIRLALEREYASMFPRPERLVEVEASGPVDAWQLADRLRAFAA
jgi:hypothetical protein